MSNYPPGVTGNEWQIAGPTEVERSVTCDAKDVEIHNISKAGIEHLMTARAKVTALTQKHNPPDVLGYGPEEKRQIAVDAYTHLIAAVQNMSDGADVDCPFEGDVTVYFCDGLGIWHCPCCGTEHEVEDDEPRDDY